MHASNSHGESGGGAVDCDFPRYGAYFDHGGIGSYGVAFNTDTWYQGATLYRPNYFLPPGTSGSHAHDFMSYGGQPFWTSPYTFNALARAFNYLPPLTGTDCDDLNVGLAAGAPLPAAPASPAVPVDLIRIAGSIRVDHSVEWRASFHTQGDPPAPGIQGDYSLELRDSNGVLYTSYFDGLQTTHGGAGDVSFSELLPWPAGVTRILLKHHDYVLDERVISANAPTVTVTAPNGGESVGSQLTVSWLGSDPDGGLLTYSVLYNSGLNAEWWPIAVGLTGTAGTPLSYTVATDLLAGSNQALVKVRVSDGVHAGEDESDAAFSLPKKAPLVAILHPAGNAELQPEAETFLLGAAYDAEGGSLFGAALEWNSDRDGPLGQGSHLHVHLSPGTHHLTLTATDSDLQQAFATLTVYVYYKLYLPLVLR